MYRSVISKLFLEAENACKIYTQKCSAWAATKVLIDSQLDGIKEAKTYKSERIIVSKQAAHIKVKGDTRSVINFCANNYLGLSSDPDIIEAGKKALDEYGAGLSSVRFICGTQKLQESSSARIRLIATDGVFSMDGNIAPLPEICALAKKYNALVFVDECHATGVLGKTGRGTEEHFNLNGKVDIINSTLGKALGGAAGGYTTAKSELVDLLRQKSRPYLFSNALPPAVVACGIKALDILTENSRLVNTLQENTKKFRSAMKAAGMNIIGDDHPICPVMVAEENQATLMANKMLDRGIYVIGFTYPVVPKNKARVRVQISAAHSEQDIIKAVESFKEVAHELSTL
ncbi:2-amino-3-ketobutyrate coenzyme A ligase like protein [Argiope bruennichi]|uniref:2-amino-3-ketobutyrate coenzyme A ligase like protein n=1 Tax=Argiope bruennichi TaxID=94029 RepID=A0A8T0FW26_ARGBR|nr:2-amino-3-ketobutyrate coenzyme A ligase like protein [Argiope bruennichi]